MTGIELVIQGTVRVVVFESWSRGASRLLLSGLGLGIAKLGKWELRSCCLNPNGGRGHDNHPSNCQPAKLVTTGFMAGDG